MEKLQHISRQYSRQLEAVRRKVLKMGGLVESQVAGAVECMVTGDAERARQVANQDYQINALEVQIDASERRCLKETDEVGFGLAQPSVVIDRQQDRGLRQRRVRRQQRVLREPGRIPARQRRRPPDPEHAHRE